MFNMRNTQMLTSVMSLEEHQQMYEDVDRLHEAFTEEQVEKAEYYEIDEDPVTMQTNVTLYDGSKVALTTVKVEDKDVAQEYMSEYFDLEPNGDEDETVDPTVAAVNSRYGHNA